MQRPKINFASLLLGCPVLPTIITHAVLPVAGALAAGKRRVQIRLLAVGALAAIVPDVDVLAFRFGIAYADVFGHRGASHSLFVAVFLGAFAALFATSLHVSRTRAFAFVTLCTASHGVLDMATRGGLGVAFFWPLSPERFFLPWRPIAVSPLTLSAFLGGTGLRVVISEFLWVWLPAFLIAGIIYRFRRGSR